MSVCIHGSLHRQCETCDLADRLAVAEGNCGSCAHRDEDQTGEYLTVCTRKGGFYNGKLMERESRCRLWEAKS